MNDNKTEINRAIEMQRNNYMQAVGRLGNKQLEKLL